jgi:hypothetical protein
MYYGKTPIEAEISVGNHELLISKAGYETQKVLVVIKEGVTDQSIILEKKITKQADIELIKKNENTISNRNEVSKYYFGIAGDVGHLMDIGLEFGAYFSHFNIEAYGNYGLQTTEFYSYENTYIVRPFSYGGRIGVGIPAGNSLLFTPQFGAGCLMVYGEDTRAYSTTLSLGMRCEWSCLGKLGISVVPEYAWGIKSDVMHKLALISPIVERWCSGFGVRFGMFVNF